MRHPNSGTRVAAPAGQTRPFDRRRRPFRVNAVAMLMAVMCAVCLAPDARAQGYVQPSGLGGFMQGLLGGGQPSGPSAYPQTAPRPMPLEPMPYPHGRQSGQRLDLNFTLPQSRSTIDGRPQTEGQPRKSSRSASTDAAASLGGGLRTMCVRLCDGFYWPLTFDARRSRLDHDAKVCSASCASEARVFVMPKSGEAKEMVDAQGRPYVKLPNAFKYRKIPAGSCTCRPDPWDEEARARHEQLAAKTNDPHQAETDRTSAVVDAASESERTPTSRETAALTLADAHVLGLAGGLVQPGSGLPPIGTVAEKPDAGKVATAPISPSTAVAGTAEAPKAQAAVKPVKSADAKRAATRAKPDETRLRVAATHHRPTPMVVMPGPYSMPIRYPAHRYVISPALGPTYRSY